MSRILAALWLVLLSAVPARAAIVDVDLLSPGDALVTRDTATGLEWLDVNLTTNLSYAEIDAGAGGWQSMGFRHATGAEVCGLMQDLGAAPSPCPTPYPGISTPLQFPLSGATVQPMIDRLGATSSSLISGSTLSVSTVGFYDDGSIGSYTVGQAEIERQTDQNAGIDRGRVDVWDGVTGVGLDKFTRYPKIGHFLVRAVPEPRLDEVLAVGALALGWAGGCRRRLRTRPA